MNERILAKRYISALIGQQSSDSVARLEDALAALDILTSNQALTPFLYSPIQSKDDKQSIITSITSKLTVTDTTIKFLHLLAEKQRLTLIPYLKDEIKGRISDLKNVLDVQVYTAQQPTQKIKDNIISTLSKHMSQTLNLTFKEDPTVIGGFKAVVGTTIYDGSIKTILGDLKQTMVTTS